jgi:type I restriction enzyme S subunit
MGQAPSGEAYNDSGNGWPLLAGAGDFGEKFPTAKKFTSEASRISEPGDIVLGIRASIGEKVIADAVYCLGRGVAGLRAGPKLEQVFLWHWLTHNTDTLKRKARGATFKQVNKNDIGELEINLPELVEQRRIAAILDQADALRAKRREALAELDGLAQAIFVEMFGDPHKNPKGWDCHPIKEISNVVTGNTPPRERQEYYGFDIDWIKSDNINNPSYYLTRSNEKLSELGRKIGRIAPAGSVLVTCIAGSPECIGNSGIADREVAFNQQINALVPKTIDPHFLYGLIRASKKLIQAASTNGMKGMLSKSKLEAVRLMVPPMDLQKSFSIRIQALESLKATHRTALTELDALFASLQHRAFRGEL